MVSQKKKIMDNMETYPVFYIVFGMPSHRQSSRERKRQVVLIVVG